jgi:hypothetical protein
MVVDNRSNEECKLFIHNDKCEGMEIKENQLEKMLDKLWEENYDER